MTENLKENSAGCQLEPGPMIPMNGPRARRHPRTKLEPAARARPITQLP
jgi:hypothetical protein